jgi:hypothetical protein
VTDRHWLDWHDQYNEAGSTLSRRLELVRAQIQGHLDRAAPGPIRAISICAGQGRDLIGVLANHPRRRDVTSRLVELDPDNAAEARRLAADAGLDRVEVVTADASVTTAYEGAVPADLVLACGVFGNITDADIDRTIGYLPTFCAPGATLIWTRHRMAPDATPRIRARLADVGFEEVAFEPVENAHATVGTNRLASEPPPFERDVKLFEFVGWGELANG